MMNKNHGFTLIELVLTLSLLSILGVSAITAMVNVGTMKADVAAQKLMADLAYARELARSRNVIHGVSFNAATDTYTVYQFNPATGVETAVTSPHTQTPMVINYATAPGLTGVDIQNPSFGGGSNIRFAPIGTPQIPGGAALAAAGTVVLAQGGVSRTVSVQPNTGEVNKQ